MDVSVTCEKCGGFFNRPMQKVNQSVAKGWHQFCSKECKLDFQSTTIETPCGACGKVVYRKEHARKSSKSGFVFCDRSCAATYNNTVCRRGEHHPNFKKAVERRLEGFIPIRNNYRTICFLYHERKCVVCSERIAVDAHHLDGNHANNDPSNLIPLCPTHHRYWHSKYRSLIESKVNEYRERFLEAVPLLERQEEFDIEEF
jgi:HNH endonuclease